MADFRKLGLDRMATGIAKAVGGGSTTLSTGDITKGTIVVIELDGESPGYGKAEVSARRTGAICLGWAEHPPSTSDVFTWTIEGNLLSVQGPNGSKNILTFWVF